MLKQARSVGIALVTSRVKRRVRAIAVRGSLGFAGAIVFFGALCFLLLAAHLGLSALINPIASAAIIGGVLLVAALILFLLASRPIKAGDRKGQDSVEEAVDELKESVSRLGDRLGTDQPPLKNPIVVGAGLALVIGFLLGRRDRRRDET